MTDDLITWLRTQLDDDERDWSTPWGQSRSGAKQAAFMLAEINAKQRILDLHPLTVYTDEEPGYSQVLNDHLCPGDQTPCATLRLLALPYADRAGYRIEWLP